MSDPRITLLREAEEVLDRLRGAANAQDLAQAREVARRLRGMREFSMLERVGEAVGRQSPENAVVRCWYAQALIETGKATVAIDVLRPIVSSLPGTEKVWGEAQGLIGRAHKQVFFDALDKQSPSARQALEESVAAYRKVMAAGGSWTWQGINVVAGLAAARRLGIGVAPEVDHLGLAKRVLEGLCAVPATDRDEWHAATAAEAYLALGEWDNVAANLGIYIVHPRVEAFHLASTLRQFTEVWGLDQDPERGQPILAMLQAQLMRKPGGLLRLTAADASRFQKTPVPSGRWEAILGRDGPKTYRWLLVGLDRARSVVAIDLRGLRRHGSGFLMRARDLGFDLDELVVVTNHHVVNEEGSGGAIRPAAAEVVLEAMSPVQRIDVDKILWGSPRDRHDACILKLKSQPVDVKPLPTASTLPVLDEPQRVYVIGYPGGRELAFSLQDNELLDHEGPSQGTPAIPGVVRLHYRAPTEGGSSGSPVFNEEWSVIGIHHLGGQLGVSKLNGKDGSYGANEGLWIQAVIQAIASQG